MVVDAIAYQSGTVLNYVFLKKNKGLPLLVENLGAYMMLNSVVSFETGHKFTYTFMNL